MAHAGDLGLVRVRRITRSALLVASIGIAALGGGAAARDATSLRTLDAERRVQDIRNRVDRAPARSAYDLAAERRRLRWLQMEAPRDAAPWRLERELTRLEWQADRVARTRARAQARLAAERERLPVPDYLRPPYDVDLRASQEPIGTGKLYILIQNGLRGAAANLAAGRRRAAAANLTLAEARLSELKARPEASGTTGDPSIIAAQEQLASLKAELAAAGEG